MWPVLRNWNARRSGAAITLIGQGPDGKIISISNVTLMTATGDGIVAKLADGKIWRLAQAADAGEACAAAQPVEA